MRPTKREKKKKRGLIRLQGVLVLSAFIGVTSLYGLLFFDTHLKQLLESYGTAVNGASFNIGSLRTSLWKSRIELRGVQIAHNTQPMRNLLEIDRVSLDFLAAQLLRKKFVVTNLEITGIRQATSREKSGLVSYDSDQAFTSYGVGILERASSSLFPNLHQEYRDSVLGKLGQFSMGLEMQPKFDSIRNKLRCLQTIQGVNHDLDAQKERWQTIQESVSVAGWFEQNRDLLKQISTPASRTTASVQSALQIVDSVKTEAQEKRKKTIAAVDTLRTQDQALQNRLKHFDQSMTEDITTLRRTLGLPNLDNSNLTPLIFGPRAVNYLERMGYWIEFSRRKMAKGSRQGQLILTPDEASAAVTIHFGKMSAYPSVLIEHGTVTSDLSNETTSGKVHGTFEGLTSDPPVYGNPAHIAIDADFPGLRINGAHIDAMINHTGETSREKISVTVESFPVLHWAVHSSPDLSITVGKGAGELRIQGEFDDNKVTGDWTAQIRNIDYEVATPYQALADTLQRVFNRFPTVDVNGKISGTADKMEMRLSSDMGKQVASALRSEFHNSVEAIDDSLRKYLLDEFEKPRQRLSEKVSDFRSQWETFSQSQLKSLDTLLALANQAQSRLGGGRGSEK